jgi:hypothetical protein
MLAPHNTSSNKHAVRRGLLVGRTGGRPACPRSRFPKVFAWWFLAVVAGCYDPATAGEGGSEGGDATATGSGTTSTGGSTSDGTDLCKLGESRLGDCRLN